MKKILPLIFVSLFFSLQLLAQQSGYLVFNEGFILNNGSLNTANNPGSGWINTNNNGPYVQVNNTFTMDYTGYASGDKFLTLSQINNADAPYKPLAYDQPISNDNNTVIYMSFVVRVNSANASSLKDIAGLASIIDPAHSIISLRNTANGNDYLNFFVGKNGNGTNNNLAFGIRKNGNSYGAFDNTQYNYNSTYLILLKYIFLNGTDQMYMWVNPNINSEPSTNSANVSLTTNFFNLTPDIDNPLSLVKLTQTASGATADIDQIKIAYATGGSTASSNSSLAWIKWNSDNIENPLPVKFGAIKATPAGSSVKIDWQTYNEVNVDHYEVERSVDGVHFSSVGSVAANNVTQLSNYSLTDASPLSGSSFYRVKNVDIDGKFSYSVIVKVSTGSQAARMALYPNPAASGSNIALQLTDLQKGTYKLRLFNSAGQEVFSQQLVHTGGSVTQSLQLPSSLRTGIYNVQLSGMDVKWNKALVIE